MFVVEVAIEFLNQQPAAGKREESIDPLLHLLHSPAFDVEIVINGLKSISGCRIVCQKVDKQMSWRRDLRRQFQHF